MHHNAPIAPLRLARLTRWIGLMLCALAACAAARQEGRPKPWLDYLRRGIVALIVVRAEALLPAWKAKRRYGPRVMRAAQRRAWFGVRLRRMGAKKDVRAQVSALWNLLCAVDAHAKRLARRLRGGLSRRGVVHAQPPRVLKFPVSRACCALPHADTS